MSRHRHPEGSKLPALERNILKYRAFEMMLTLFYAEDIKQFLVGTIKATDRWRDNARKWFPKGPPHYRAVVERLAKEGYITDDQRDDIIQIVDYRNDIAHELEKMTFDVSRSTYMRGIREFSQPRYDYGMLERAKFYRRFLPDKAMRQGFVFELSMNALWFRSAEQTYERELKVLKKKIFAQEDKRKLKLGKLVEELKLPDDLPEVLWPYHPANERANGTLNLRGIEIAYRLFDRGKSTLAVGYMMHISKKALDAHYKNWLKLGGKDRPPVQLPDLYERLKMKKKKKKKKSRLRP
ncbi:hypothetical protein ACQR1V_26885 [Bradyrhizobium oligotrophicum]|uniref:hypothetical protein n=1 Tax=Bradyrhizobium oligotrophicum TaxID=44255 RepID=UPI003EBFB92F